ncbi:MAG: hypothetical protein NUV54_03160 [Candidatus Taylorbacteria bacterium]|nr:hypothetical protein [Candidatus Taylorbacteria bacterium]
MMDPNYYQFWDDLPVFAWIGADNCTNTRIREVCSGLSCPVGCKHPKQLGSLISAVRALGFVSVSNTFLAQNDSGKFTQFTSEGNTGCIIHRGYELKAGEHVPNFSKEEMESSREMLLSAGLNPRKMVDLNHSNSGKDHTKQREVLDSVLAQRADGNDLVGVVWEVNLEEGKQTMPENPADLKWGVSITDACDSFETMEQKVLQVADALRAKTRSASLQAH